MVTLSLAELPGDSGQIVLAMGGLDNKIHLYCGGRSGKVSLSAKLYIINFNFWFLIVLSGGLCLKLFYFSFTYEPSLYMHVS